MNEDILINVELEIDYQTFLRSDFFGEALTEYLKEKSGIELYRMNLGILDAERKPLDNAKYIKITAEKDTFI